MCVCVCVCEGGGRGGGGSHLRLLFCKFVYTLLNTFKKFHEICFCSYFREIWIFRENNYIFEISRPRAYKMIYIYILK